MSSAAPRDLSHLPLCTDARLPECTVNPPFERKYGGSAKIMSKDSGGRSRMIFRASPCNKRNPSTLYAAFIRHMKYIMPENNNLNTVCDLAFPSGGREGNTSRSGRRVGLYERRCYIARAVSEVSMARAV